MSSLPGKGPSPVPQYQDRLRLLMDLAQYQAEWNALLNEPTPPLSGRLTSMERTLRDLRTRAQGAGLGGLDHHLGQFERLLGQGFDRQALRGAMQNVAEIAWQVRQELDASGARDERVQGSESHIRPSTNPARPGQVGQIGPGGPLTPPPMLTVHPDGSKVARPSQAMPAPMQPAPVQPRPMQPPMPPGAMAPPPPISVGRPQQPAAIAPPGGAQGPAMPRAISIASAPSPFAPGPQAPVAPAPAMGPLGLGRSPGHAQPAAGPAPQAPPRAQAPPPQTPFEHPIAGVSGQRAPFDRPLGLGSARPPSQPPAPPLAPPNPPVVAAPPPIAPSRPEGPPEVAPPPRLQVRTMFGLRAFNRPRATEDPGPRGSLPSDPGTGSSLLGLKRKPGSTTGSRPVRSQLPPPDLGGHLPVASHLPPPMIGGELPDLPAHNPGATNSRFDAILDRMGRGKSAPADTGSRRAVKKRPPPRAKAAAPSSTVWWVIAAGAVVASGALIAGVIAWSRSRDTTSRLPPVPTTSGSVVATTTSAGGSQRKLRGETLNNENERFAALLAQMHGHGGKESAELRALVDDQASLQSKILGGGPCQVEPALCDKIHKARDVLTGPERKIARRERAGGDQPRSKWLMGLHMPDIDVADDPRVQRVFEYYTQHPVGRERFQSILFRCGRYRDIIQATLVRYEMPTALFAVVLAESGCEPMAKSPVGARGLWQFMPDAARAYHMRVIEDVIDERISPPKSTEGGVHFLADIYKKVGAWDLTFASYNMGPFGLLARIDKAGGDAGFWDLVDADMLPEETALYVPHIEAFALILENLSRLKFAGTQTGTPEVTAELEVPAGTRLGLVAHAASTSINQLRTLNLDIIGDRVPSVAGPTFTVQVQRDVVWQARDALQALIQSGTEDDLCVAPTFDWGKQRFSAEMAEECRRRGRPSTTPPANDSPNRGNPSPQL